MSKPKRKPIEYPSSFAGDIFRPADVIAQEVAALEEPASLPPLPTNGAVPFAERVSAVNPETRKHGNKQTRLHVKTDTPAARPKPRQADTDNLDSADLLKYSVYFTQTELDELEDLKIALRRKNGLACTKYNIVREAFLDMLEDYTAHGDDSRLVQRLRKALG